MSRYIASAEPASHAVLPSSSTQAVAMGPSEALMFFLAFLAVLSFKK